MDVLKVGDEIMFEGRKRRILKISHVAVILEGTSDSMINLPWEATWVLSDRPSEKEMNWWRREQATWEEVNGCGK